MKTQHNDSKLRKKIFGKHPLLKYGMLALIAMITVSALAVCVAEQQSTSSADSPATDFTGYTSISTPQDLAKIGNDSSYPLDGNYYLTNDIIFTLADDTNGGIDIGISATVTGTDLTVTLTPPSGDDIVSMYAWLGTSSLNIDYNNTVTLSDIPSGIYTMTISGMAGVNPFVYSAQIDTSTSGQKISGVTFNSNGNFNPVGTSSSPFKGIFDGNGHEIKGINASVFSLSESAYSGLFGYMNNAQIRNLGVVDSNIVASSVSGYAYAGGIVGCGSYNSAIIITNCHNTGDVSATATSSGTASAGGIVGCTDRSSITITNCYNAGDVSAIASPDDTCAYAGGIAGCINLGATVTNCYNTGNITVVSGSGTDPTEMAAYAGGIIGNAFCPMTIIITNCYNAGDVSATSISSYAYAGGIVGYESSAIITNCYNTGNITATALSSSSYEEAYAGGIIGNASGFVTITNCYNAGDVSATASSDDSSSGAYTGGIVGLIGGAIIMNCYNTGSVSATASSSYMYDAYAGGIVSYVSWNWLTTITNCYFIANKISHNLVFEDMICANLIDPSSVVKDGDTGDQASGAKTVEQMTPTLQYAQNGNSIYFVGTGGWDFINTWTIVAGENSGYPILQSSLGQVVSGGGFTPITPYTSVSAIPNGYTPIYTFQDLMNINTDSTTLSRKYILMNDITFTDEDNAAFVPIGNFITTPFGGIFDGNGYKVSGMNVNISSSSNYVYAGLFGFVLGGQILNLSISNSMVTATTTYEYGYAYAGGIVGYANLATVTNCYNAGDISANALSDADEYFEFAYAGGIVGYADLATVTNCYNAGDVSATASSSSSAGAYASGVIGYAYGSVTITNCYNVGNVSVTASSLLSSFTDAYAGGIVSFGFGTTITNCYNTGDVSAVASSYAYAGGISSYAVSAIITNCYNTGDVSVSSDYASTYAGGIVGGVQNSAIIKNCCNSGDVSVSSDCASTYAGGIVGDVRNSATAVTNCYNAGVVSAIVVSSSSFAEACAGGLIGQTYGSVIITNCYNTGDITAASDNSIAPTETAFAGGIVGYAGLFSKMTASNCYFLEGTVSGEMMVGNISDLSMFLNDGNIRDQASGAKAVEQMTPTLQDARNGNSTYYVGNGGWDFSDGGIWTLVAGENNGYPILQFPAEQSVPGGGYIPITPYTPIPVIHDGYKPIYSFKDLMYINTSATTLGGNYILMNDIVFTDDDNVAFVPIGNPSSPFTGTFDGNGHEISGMNVNVQSSNDYDSVYIGLFGYVSGAQIYDLGIADSVITVSTSSSSASVYAGGIVGYANSLVMISNCHNASSISVTSPNKIAYTGGIAGYVYSGMIENCYNTGNISVTASLPETGGIVGEALSAAKIENCYNTGNITATSVSQYATVAGGIAGEAISAIKIENCYNTGSVLAKTTSSNTAQAGGIVGFADGLITITNCYNIGNVSAVSSSPRAGGIVGDTYSTIMIENCYFLEGIVSNNAIAEDIMCGNITYRSPFIKDGGTGDQISGAKTTEQMTPTLQDAQNGNSIYYLGNGGWDFSDGGVWTIVEGENREYPTLQSLSEKTASGGYAQISPYISVSVAPEGYTPIYSFDDLMNINTDTTTLGGKYILMNDITFTAQNNEDFMPIGNNTTGAFTGIFDGNGHKIIGMNVNISSSDIVYAGLFGTMLNAQLCNLGVVDSTIDVSSQDSAYAGGIVGYAGNSVTIMNCYNTGDIVVSAPSNILVGGIVGYAYPAIIENCYNTGDISIITSSSGACAGGIAGYTIWVMIENCYNTGDISATASSTVAHAGGIVGYENSSIIIENCYNTGDISATASSDAHAGGIGGYVGSATITNCYNAGDISATASSDAHAGGIGGYVGSATITNCYNTGTINASNNDAYAGGIVGYANGAEILINCFNSGNVLASSDNDAYAGGISGGTSYAAMMNCYTTGNVTAEASSSAYAGGMVGSAARLIVANCYGIGDTSSSASTAYAGGIMGYATNQAITIENSYFLKGVVSHNMMFVDGMCGNISNLLVVRDGGTGDQISGAKTMEQMTPPLQDAQNSSSIYYTGNGGWDFEGVWTIAEGKNKGYPILSSFATKTITGTVTDGTDPLENVTITYLKGVLSTSVNTDSDGRYTITSDYGTAIIITDITKVGYAVDGPMPLSFNMTMDFIQDFTMTARMLTISGIVTDGTNPLEGVTITYFDGFLGIVSVVTGADGTYSGAVSYGGYFMVVGVCKSGYTVDGLLFNEVFASSDIVQNFTMIADYTGAPIPISTPEELALIGNDSSYPRNGDYYLTNDIFFNSSIDTNGGVDIGISVIVSGTNLNINVMSHAGSVTSLYVWMERTYADSSSGTVSLTDIPQGAYTLTIGGMLDASIPFSYSLEIDTTVSGEKAGGTFNSNGNFSPIGTVDAPFTGTFDGRNHSIIGMDVDVFDTQSAFAGVFGFISSAQIMNLGVESSSVTVASLTGTFAGGIVGWAYSCESIIALTDCHNTGTVVASSQSISYSGGIIGGAYTYDAPIAITNCYNSGRIASMSNDGVDNYSSAVAGGIASYGEALLKEMFMDGCHNTGTVTAAATYSAYIGGIACYASGKITNCYNEGEIAPSCLGYVSAGGITAGESDSLTIENSHNTGSIVITSSDSVNAGGITSGLNTSGSAITNCYNTGSITIISSYSTWAEGSDNSSTTEGVRVGGIAGDMFGNSITGCYNTGSITVSASGEDALYVGVQIFAGGISGLAPYEMTGCYNTGAITLSATSSLQVDIGTGGIVGWIPEQATLADCYNTGAITISAASAEFDYVKVGGIAGWSWSNGTEGVAISNCYNISPICISSSAEFDDVKVGGIAGYLISESVTSVDNCYFLEGQITVNGNPSADVICNYYDYNGIPIVDGNIDGTPRQDIQGSGAKTMEQMTPTLQDAQNGNSTYYVGSGGWDFSNGGVWTIVAGNNSGYPVLQALPYPDGDSSPNSYTITASADSGSMISPNGAIPIEEGNDQTFFFSANSGSSITAVYVDGSALSSEEMASGLYTFINIQSDHTISVVSQSDLPEGYVVTLSAGTGYTLTPVNGSASPVEYNSSFSFTISLDTEYDKSMPTVKVNGVVLKPSEEVYTITNINEDKTVTVEGVNINSYNITLTTGTGYVLAPTPGSSTPVNYACSYSFTLSAAQLYDISSATVYVNGTPISLMGGVYTITDITENKNVTVTGVTEITNPTYSVLSLPILANAAFQYRPEGEAFWTSVPPNGMIQVLEGTSVEIAVIPNSGYTFDWGPDGESNGNILTVSPTSSTQTIECAITLITEPGVYPVSLSIGTGYTLLEGSGSSLLLASGPSPLLTSVSSSLVASGGSYSFTLKLQDQYSNSVPVVKANGMTLTSIDGIYTVEDITSPISITVENVEFNTFGISMPAEGTGYTLTPVDGQSLMVAYNGSFSFTLSLGQGYSNSLPVVKANGVVLTPSGDTYTIYNINEAKSITVENVIVNMYLVSIPDGEGYLITMMDSKIIEYNGTFRFTLSVLDGYDGSSMIVNVNGSPITSEGGIYTISSIIDNMIVTVDGVLLIHMEGDLNGDGSLNNIDVMMLMTYLAGGGVTIDLQFADMNGDGHVDNIDVMIMMTIVAGG